MNKSLPACAEVRYPLTGVQLRVAVAMKCHKVKYTPLKGGVLNFGTLRYVGTPCENER